MGSEINYAAWVVSWSFFLSIALRISDFVPTYCIVRLSVYIHIYCIFLGSEVMHGCRR